MRSSFDLLREEWCARIEVVTRNGAPWIACDATERCPGAGLVMSLFRALRWVTEVLDELRRRA